MKSGKGAARNRRPAKLPPVPVPALFETREFNPATLALLNRLVPGATPQGAYAMGMVSQAVWIIDPALEIPDIALIGARACTTLQQADNYARAATDWATHPARKFPRAAEVDGPGKTQA